MQETLYIGLDMNGKVRIRNIGRACGLSTLS